MKKELVIPLRRLLACAAVATVATATFGAAATMGIAGDNAAATSRAVGRCDDGAIGVDYVGDPGPVTGITITGVAAACASGLVSASVRTAAGGLLASGTATVPGGGGSVTVNFATSVDPALIQRYLVTIVTA